MRLRSRAHRLVAVALGCTAASISGCTDVDPYEVQCRELVSSPSRLREVTLQLADKNVVKKVEYEDQILRICADAPEDYRPVQKIEPEN